MSGDGFKGVFVSDSVFLYGQKSFWTGAIKFLWIPKGMVLLMELFGYSSPSITKKYFEIREREIHDVYDSLRL